ncbi:restriction endonuclease subunit S [Burkholderia vietnamiensis]|uniref:restriction endonuclease subunit S n=1 Tax=Burkholderia vietnamiensis TaxID=60552 RepID=UPI001592FC5C|nr:restriction endonuclease subunit S [Burkholderia vietnamiensis]WHU93357.1 restriction endonuclease subunit S [Burkholderia vietnamiensis]CAJ5815933.1 restriction modification system DNA specificity domain-containing protein [Burkholderia pseudomallei]HDR9164157.1 restriction endonuclease subunit S [Burkholderia vietnamiensis]
MGLLDTLLPNGRRWARVGDCFEVTRKPRGLNAAGHDTVPFVPMEAIPQGGHYEPRYDTRPGPQITSGTYFERDDLLIAKITPSFENGKQAWARGLPAPFGYATTEVIPLRPSASGNDRRLLFFYLLHPEIRSYVSERMEGSTGRQRVPEQVLLDLPYPELPPDEQRPIADALEHITRQIELEERSARTAQALKRATMRELFMHGLRGEAQKETGIGLVPKNWHVVPLGSLGKIGNGSTPKKTVPAYWNGGTFPWLTSAKVYDREIETADQFVTDIALAECHLPRVRPGAVLMAITGQGKTLGHCAVLKLEASISQHVAYLQTDTEQADPGFVRGYLETQYEYLRQVASGGGSTKGALTCAFLRDLPVPLPPTLDEQREIVTILDTLDRKISLHRQKRSVLEELFQSLLHKLMTGDISITDLDLSVLSSASTHREEVAV